MNTPVLEIYRITLLSNNSVLATSPSVVLEIYRITLLSNEVIQNVRMIVTTVRGSVPLYRDFGIDPTIIDAPTQIAEAKLSTDIIRQVRKYEPRAQITNLTFQQTTDGHTTPHISITVKEE